jgi:hypothetical protein
MQAVVGARYYKIVGLRIGLCSTETGGGTISEGNLAFRKGLYSVGTGVETRVCQTSVVNSHGRNYFVKVARCKYC